MTRDVSRRRSIVITTCVSLVLALNSLAAQTPVQIHPTAGSQGGPIIIAVLADRFTSAQEADFNEAAANFFIHGLLADPYYAAQAANLTVTTIFEPWTEATPSKYGFELGAGVTNCSIHWNEATTTDAIETAAAGVNPTRKVVIGNHNFNFGCTEDDWTYIAVGAVGQQILQHEFGHLIAGLYDEFALPGNENSPHPDGIVTRANCSTNTANPHWMALGLQGVQNDPTCALFGQNIVHPFATCKMGVHGGPFCEVCRLEMDAAIHALGNPDLTNPELRNPDVVNPDVRNPNVPNSTPPKPPSNIKISGAGFFIQPPPQPPSDNRVVRLLLTVNRKPGTPISVVRATDVTGRAVSQSRRVGDYVYEITERGKPLAVAVLPGDPFQQRSYRGGVTQHATAAVPTASIVVQVPGATRQTLLDPSRAVEIAFYKLSPTVGNEPVTQGRLNEYKASKQAEMFARIDPTELKAALKQF